MLFQTINPGDAETGFATMRNGEGATLPEGGLVQYDTATTQDGRYFRQLDSGLLWAVCGALHASCASDSTTNILVQVFGYDDDVLFFQTDTSIAAGQPLIAVAAVNYCNTAVTTTASNAAVTQQPFFGVLAESVATSSASAIRATKVFLRCM